MSFDQALPFIWIVFTAVVAAVIGAFVGSQVAGKSVADKIVTLIDALHSNPALQDAIDALYNSAPVAVQDAVQEGVKVLDAVDELGHDITSPAPKG